jgi:ribonuclease HII
MVVVGIDEVGRGCWAGPLVAGAVILNQPIVGLKDSKLLSKRRRELLASEIQAKAMAFGLGWVPAAELDQIGLTKAVRLAMHRALGQIDIAYDSIIIDGNYNFLDYLPTSRALIKADNLEPSVSAASIIAKVARDRHMADAARQYPNYGFEKHVGYGTAYHAAMLKQHGLCQIHRRSFRPIKLLAGV